MNIDLNLLRILHSIYAERSISRAAIRLGLSQPRVSNALASLRELLQDQLFVREPGGVSPTAFMRRLAPYLNRGFDAFEEGLVQQLDFSPMVSRRIFRIQMSDSAELLFSSPLRKMLQREAPHAILHTQSGSGRDISQALTKGDIDFAIGRYSGNESILQRRLFDERYVLLRDGSQEPREYISQDMLADLEFLVVGDYPDVAQLIADFGLESRIRLRTSSYLAVPSLLEESGMSLLLPYGVAKLIAPPGNFEIHEPFDPPRKIPLSVYCYRLAPEDTGLAWLWERIVPALCFPKAMDG